MARHFSYLIALAAIMGVPAGLAAQAPAPPERQMYCTGISTIRPVKFENYVISGEESEIQLVYSQGQKVFINRGAQQGVKVGDQFLVSRVESDFIPYPWFKGQQDLARMMGTFVADVGRIRVVAVQQKTATAEVTLACDYLQRGDGVEPFVERPAPPYKANAKLDLYAPPSNKPKGTLVFSDQYGQLLGVGRIAYVDLGTLQGVKVGDYLRVFRYQGEHQETVYNYPHTAYSEFGLGSTPQPYIWSDLPRDILGEGLVLRVSPTAATVLITASHRQIFMGDFVEIE